MIWSNTFGYKLLLVLHLLSVVIGFGPWMLNGLLPRLAARRPAEEARAVNAAAYQVSTISQYGIYGAFVFGFAVLGVSKSHGVKTISASEAWVWISVVCWVVIVGVLHGLALPTQRKLRDGEGDTAALTRQLSMAAGVINLLVVLVVVLMVFEPGSKVL